MLRRKTKLRALLIFIAIAFVLILWAIWSEEEVKYVKPVYRKRIKFLINNKKCKIPDVDPFNEEIKRFYKLKKYNRCSKFTLLTFVTKDESHVHATVHINKTALKQYSSDNIYCCYSGIDRKASDDNDIFLTECQLIIEKSDIDSLPILVKCHARDILVYENVHYAITIQSKILHKMKNVYKPRFSVLIIGIDGLSRLNMMRTMPLTNHFLIRNNFTDMKAFNKMGDNTFPNLMATLTGRNEESAKTVCNPFEPGYLDSCNIIWKDFNQMQFITAYAEDIASLGTFNYLKEGFKRQPVDYYYRPLMIAAEKNLRIRNLDGIGYCSGPVAYGERIMNAAKDFSTTLIDEATFGLFWMNSFSHDDLNAPTRMDRKVYEFLVYLKTNNVFENSIVIFMSDHGLRFGKSTATYTGWLEERLPMLFIYLPDKFKSSYYRKFKHLQDNANKLITHYDLYMTLQDILALDTNYKVNESQGCPECKSLFEKLGDRSCEDLSIDTQWCTCYQYEDISIQDKNVTNAVKIMEIEINSKTTEHPLCHKFVLKTITCARISKAENHHTNETYLLVIAEFFPMGVFETSFTLKKNLLTFHSKINRIDRYGTTAYCMSDPNLKPFCHCPNKT